MSDPEAEVAIGFDEQVASTEGDLSQEGNALDVSSEMGRELSEAETLESDDSEGAKPNDDVAAVEDPQKENSWRYANGARVSSSEGASTDLPSLEYGVSPMSAVENPNGYVVFNWFDQFSNGYYTGAGAYRGIDVSYHNGAIDWTEVKESGVDFAILRCGYGKDIQKQDDEQWLNNVRGCQQNGIPFGVYLYSYATDTDRASSEADHVLRLLREAGLGSEDLGYPVFFDMEDASTIGSDYAAIATTFCDKVEAAGYETGVYASKSWFENYLTDSCFENWTKWVAQWNASMGLTYDGLSNFSSGNGMWQFSDYGSVPGVGGACDLNYTFIEPNNSSLDIEGVYVNQRCQLVTASDSSLVLTVDGNAASGANVFVARNDGTDEQDWYISIQGNGLVSVRSAADRNLVLDAASSIPSSGSNVSIWQTHGGNNQKWLIVPADTNGEYTLVNAANRELLLGLDGSNVVVQAPNGSNSQKWLIKYDLSEASASASGMLRNATGGQLRADVSVSMLGRELSEGEDYAVLYSGSEQAPSEPGTYEVAVRGKGGFTGEKAVGSLVVLDALAADASVPQRVVSSAGSGLVLDAAHNPPSSGANVSVYAGHGGANQAWLFEPQDDGYYVIRSAADPSLVLDAAGSRPASGSNVSVWEDNGGGGNQRWRLSPAGVR